MMNGDEPKPNKVKTFYERGEVVFPGEDTDSQESDDWRIDHSRNGSSPEVSTEHLHYVSLFLYCTPKKNSRKFKFYMKFSF